MYSQALDTMDNHGTLPTQDPVIGDSASASLHLQNKTLLHAPNIVLTRPVLLKLSCVADRQPRAPRLHSPL